LTQNERIHPPKCNATFSLDIPNGCVQSNENGKRKEMRTSRNAHVIFITNGAIIPKIQANANEIKKLLEIRETAFDVMVSDL